MFRLLFSNRWLALIWGALMLGSAVMFVGEDGAVEQLGRTMEQVAAQQRELAAANEQTETEPDFAEPIDPPTFDSGDHEPEGQVFINPETGQQVRIVRRAVSVDYPTQANSE